MRCIKCTTQNIDNANYCTKCGNKFLEEEKKAAKRWSVVWFLEWIDKIRSLWGFKFITDHILFKIFSIILILSIGVYTYIVNGSSLKILESDNYQIQYNTKLSEYYLFVDTDRANLNLYIPNKISKVTVKHLDRDAKIIAEKTYSNEEHIVLENNTASEDYYLISSEDGKNSQSLKLYIYREENLE